MSLYSGYIRQPHYYETDQMAIIHHANYIRWFEEARVDMLAFLQLPYHKIEEAGLIVPVLEVNAQYKEMIRMRIKYASMCSSIITPVLDLIFVMRFIELTTIS